VSPFAVWFVGQPVAAPRTTLQKFLRSAAGAEESRGSDLNSYLTKKVNWFVCNVSWHGFQKMGHVSYSIPQQLVLVAQMYGRRKEAATGAELTGLGHIALTQLI